MQSQQSSAVSHLTSCFERTNFKSRQVVLIDFWMSWLALLPHSGQPEVIVLFSSVPTRKFWDSTLK